MAILVQVCAQGQAICLDNTLAVIIFVVMLFNLFAEMDIKSAENDKDMFTEYLDAFSTTYHLVTCVNLNGVDNSCVLHLATNSSNREIAAGMATSKVAICDPKTLSEKSSFKAHTGDLSGVRFSPKNDHLLYTCSPQECIKLWDLRDYAKPARTFVDTSTQNGKAGNGHTGEDINTYPKKPLIAFDVNIEDKFLAGGTEEVVKDAFLLFWDVGSGKMLGGYWNSYGDDVTTVAFHPEEADKLVTGGTDGLINVFDISQSSEDDALITSINTESSIQNLKWYKVRFFHCSVKDLFSNFLIFSS